jgi:hypothetical protein
MKPHCSALILMLAASTWASCWDTARAAWDTARAARSRCWPHATGLRRPA